MIVLSVLDRLSSDAPQAPDQRGGKTAVAGKGSAAGARSEYERYRATVRRDLEWLLNTRSFAEPLPEGLREVEKSVLCYGLPDFSDMTLRAVQSEEDQGRLAAMLTLAVTRFEPRILGVDVRASTRSAGGTELHFDIVGRLDVKPRPEPVRYDTVLDVNRGEYAVKVLGESRA
jgi:type VI secretion system protein ImpF